MPESIMIDGFGPLPVYRPESVAALGELVKQQRAKGEAVYPVGGGTMLDFGLPPTKPGIALDMTAFNRVIDYPARDMTITVQAGITFQELQVTLARENQWLPLDVPDPERMTIGGLIACNVSGPRRLGYGTLRDYLIGISFINDDGVEIKGGGRVVKNVAGYDLMKLHIGALGTMGVITQVTLKVRPRPEAKAALICSCDWLDLTEMHRILQQSCTRPAAACYTITDDIGFIIVCEEKQAAVDWQISTLVDELHGLSDTTSIEKRPSQVDSLIQDGLRKLWDRNHIMITKHVCLTDELAILLDHYRSEGVVVTGEMMNGILWAAGSDPDRFPAISDRVIVRSPNAWKTPESVFGKPTPAFELMRHIQRTLDPDGVFNPGRIF